MDLSVGIFHHHSGWYAVRNHCLHAGGPVAEGPLRDETLVCPWHGYQYDLSSGKLLSDPAARLEMYPVELQDGKVFIHLPIQTDRPPQFPSEAPTPARPALAKNEFRLSEIGEGQAGVVEVAGETVAVFNVAGSYYAVQGRCSHAGGPLSEGRLEGAIVACPWHGACFDLRDGSVQRGPARQALRVYPVTVENEIGRVEP
jgi:nitrite reductase/ring-hydroxylating ferredoxin subunit